ncbi:MAG: helix-turn-helix domain-containing protein [Bryobacterales bacterium]|nr:helix-turn-helix domain-containing protein [Bryobacterales bacterium]
MWKVKPRSGLGCMAFSVALSAPERQQIQQWVASHGTPQQVALRCRIVLATVDGQSDVAIAQQLSVNRKTVISSRQRFSEQRLDGLWEIAPGRGRKPNYDSDKIPSIVDATLQAKPEGRAWNNDPKPFVWTATVESIIEKSPVADGRWRRSSPAAPAPGAENERNSCPSISCTLH